MKCGVYITVQQMFSHRSCSIGGGEGASPSFDLTMWFTHTQERKECSRESQRSLQ